LIRSVAMISTSDDLYSVFLADLSEAERERVRSYADNFGIEPTDAVWALMIVLGRYSELYEAVPEKINLTVQGILEKIQSAAAAEAESSRVRLQVSLTDAVVGAAKVRAAAGGNFAEAGAGDIQNRVVEVDVVENVGEGAFHHQVKVLGEFHALTQSGRPVHRARTNDAAQLLVAEAPDGIGGNAHAAGLGPLQALARQ
jgi:hypothetical protein